jgi:hypothetical protein
MCVSLTLSDTLVIRVNAFREIERLISEFFLPGGQGLLARSYLRGERRGRLAFDLIE